MVDWKAADQVVRAGQHGVGPLWAQLADPTIWTSGLGSGLPNISRHPTVKKVAGTQLVSGRLEGYLGAFGSDPLALIVGQAKDHFAFTTPSLLPAKQGVA
jgi:hypothetical protein